MITHKEAEILTSARQDAPLDPLVERELQAHLATCDDCRAFAIATERLTAGIRNLPSVPVSPRVRREVMERVNRGRNPLAGLFGGFGGGFQMSPVLASAAMLVLVGLFGWFALDRVVFNDGNDGNNQIAAVPTAPAMDMFIASPTDVPATETPVPTAPATDVPQPTETPVTSDPTATETAVVAADPTQTPVTPDPTETVPPTETVVATEAENEGPVDLTTDTANEATTEEAVGGVNTAMLARAATAEPTGTPAAIAPSTPVATPTPPATPAPTSTPTMAPTDVPAPTNTPAIEPMDGQEPATETATDEPAGTGGESDPAVIEASDSTSDADAGTRIEGMGDGAAAESTPDDLTQTEETVSGQALVDVSVRYTGIDGDPAGHLGLTPNGRLVFTDVPDGASMTTSSGFRLQTSDVQPGVVQLCGDGYCEASAEAPAVEGWVGDTPLGVVGESTFFMRLYGDRTEVYQASSQGTQLIDAAVIGEFGPTSAPTAVYQNEGILFAWLPSGQWLEVSSGAMQVLPGAYGWPSNVRFAPRAQQGPLLGYFSNGTLVIAPVSAPDAAILTLPSDSVDFDIAPLGDRVAMIRGNDIVIYDIYGTELNVYEGGEMQPGSLIWLRGGIVFVDRVTGSLYEIPETAP